EAADREQKVGKGRAEPGQRHHERKRDGDDDRADIKHRRPWKPGRTLGRIVHCSSPEPVPPRGAFVPPPSGGGLEKSVVAVHSSAIAFMRVLVCAVGSGANTSFIKPSSRTFASAHAQ